MAENESGISLLPKQLSVLTCPCDDILIGGARGGSKTATSLFDWLKHQAIHGKSAYGMIMRRSYPELEDMQLKASRFFPLAGGEFKASRREWQFPNGSVVKMRHLNSDSDADKYQGHEYNWLSFDDAGNWASPVPIDKLRACLRSSQGIKTRLLLSCNPGGAGHNWLKARYVDPVKPMEVQNLQFPDNRIQTRVFIPMKISDNPILLKADPGYIDRITQSCPKWLLSAWLDGSWDIVAGGAFDDVFNRDVHVIPTFNIPYSWRVYRSFDWGSSKPFSVGWWAVTDGSVAGNKVLPRGSLIRIAEYYGWSGQPNEGLRMTAGEIAIKIKEIESGFNFKVYPGAADSSIFSSENGNCIADDMRKKGIDFVPSDRTPGSRKQGFELIRTMLKNGLQFPIESPTILIFDNCLQTIRTFPVLPRDKKTGDDVDTTAEDHIYDDMRYMVLSQKQPARAVRIQ